MNFHHFFFCFSFLKLQRTTVLKTGPDRPVRPGTGSQSGPVNTPKTGQKPVKNRAKTGVEPKIKKKTVWCPVRFLKPCREQLQTHFLLSFSDFVCVSVLLMCLFIDLKTNLLWRREKKKKKKEEEEEESWLLYSNRSDCSKFKILVVV